MGAFIVAIILVVGWALWANGYHIKKTPTADELFGCKKTYVNERGEDTGECR